MTNRRSLLLLPAALLLARCAPAPKPPPVLTLTMVGSADQNPDPSGNAAPVAVKVYQLGATAKFESSDWTSLTQNEAAILGPDEAAPSQQYVVAPGQTLTQTFELKPGVQDIGIIVLYRDIDHAQWRSMAPAASSGPTKLTLTIAKAAATLQPSK
ncbi:MAG TPA: type VI secretion system lipoprotein TssJ [Acetobacteraceae bacterium]|jgi:type VI secretion system protein VasD|nr:type VI secretion system lipoprotein TssJ [Acetobacteraceae bacterium]